MRILRGSCGAHPKVVGRPVHVVVRTDHIEIPHPDALDHERSALVWCPLAGLWFARGDVKTFPCQEPRGGSGGRGRAVRQGFGVRCCDCSLPLAFDPERGVDGAGDAEVGREAAPRSLAQRVLETLGESLDGCFRDVVGLQRFFVFANAVESRGETRGRGSPGCPAAW
jgi:hypothetical protein